MGFSGGGSNQTQPHTHDGLIAQDGGSLNFDNVTQGALNAGDVIYSDGVHLQRLNLSAGDVVYGTGTALQRLAIAAAGDQLQVNGGATAPEWVTPSGPSSADLELVGSEVVSGGAVSDVTLTISPAVSCADISTLFIVFTGQVSSSTNIGCRMNGISTSTYNSKGWYNFATCDWDCSNYVTTDSYRCGRSEIGTTFRVNVWVYSNDSTQKMIFTSTAAGDAGAENLGGWNSTTGITSFNEVSMTDNSGSNRFQNGTRLDVYRYNT